MKYSEYIRYDGLGLAELVRKKQVSPQELAQTALAAAEALNPQINSLIEVFPETAESATADGPFQGVPFLIKDLILQKAGVKSEAGSRLAQGLVAPANSDLMTRFEAAGLVTLGRTTTPEMGFNASTESIATGPTCNPWDLTRSPGGSSGGSAAAVAAGITPLAHGNDGGGSLRIPASWCGLFAVKPSRGRTTAGPGAADPLAGMGIEFALTRSVRDAAALLDAVEGPSPGDPYVITRPARPYAQEARTPPGKLKIAFSHRGWSNAEVSPAMRAAFERTVSLCADLGHEMIKAAPVFDNEAFNQANVTIWSTFIAHIIGILAQMTGRVPGPDTLETSVLACYEEGRKTSAGDFLAALDVFNQVRRAVGGFFTGYDLLLTPTAADAAPKLGVLDANAPGWTAQSWTRHVFTLSPFTALFNATGQPAMSVPLEQTDDGLPAGMQFVARFGDEARLFRLAGQLEEARPWFDRRPPLSLSENQP
jgi:amidase